MKNLLANLSNEKVQKELKQFLIIGYICAAVALFTLGFLSVVGVAAGARCLLLVLHKANKDNPKLVQLRTASIALLVVSTIEAIFYWAQF